MRVGQVRSTTSASVLAELMSFVDPDCGVLCLTDSDDFTATVLRAEAVVARGVEEDFQFGGHG